MPTEEARGMLSHFCEGMGLDVGYGGVSITPHTINVDLPEKRQHGGNDPQHLYGNGRNLYWFKDGTLDYVYSSHLLENFRIKDMLEFLREWLRVIKKGGLIVLYLPDEEVYRNHCVAAGANHNPAHRYDELCLSWFKNQVVKMLHGVSIIHEKEASGKFSFEIVIKKEY